MCKFPRHSLKKILGGAARAKPPPAGPEGVHISSLQCQRFVATRRFDLHGRSGILLAWLEAEGLQCT